MPVGIEFLARWIEFLDAVLLQRVEQRPLGQLDAFDERLDAALRKAAPTARIGLLPMSPAEGAAHLALGLIPNVELTPN